MVRLCKAETFFGGGSVKLIPEAFEVDGSLRIAKQDY